MHIIDTGEHPEFSVTRMDCINGMLYHLRRAPRSLLDPNDDYHDPRNNHEFRIAVARVWDPLRRRMEEQEAAEQAEQEAAEQEAVATLFPPSDEDEEGFIGNGNNAAAFQRMLQFRFDGAANLRNLQEE